MSAVRDLTGRRFGRLLVVSRSANDKRDRSMWLCTCNCGISKMVAALHLTTGQTKSCGCLARERASRLGRSKRKPPGVSAWNNLLTAHRSSARRRGLTTELTPVQFRALAELPCLYCGRVGVGRHHSYLDEVRYNGIDRFDSSLDYTVDNCVTCCADCNMLKGATDGASFVLLVRRIAEVTSDWDLSDIEFRSGRAFGGRPVPGTSL